MYLMEITVFKCYFPKCMIMCNCSPDWFFTIAETKTLYFNSSLLHI